MYPESNVNLESELHFNLL